MKEEIVETVTHTLRMTVGWKDGAKILAYGGFLGIVSTGAVIGLTMRLVKTNVF